MAPYAKPPPVPPPGAAAADDDADDVAAGLAAPKANVLAPAPPPAVVADDFAPKLNEALLGTAVDAAGRDAAVDIAFAVPNAGDAAEATGSAAPN